MMTLRQAFAKLREVMKDPERIGEIPRCPCSPRLREFSKISPVPRAK